VRALLVAVGLLAVLGAVAYGAARHAPAASSASHRSHRLAGRRPPRPRIVRHPGKVETSTRARFALADRKPSLRFECRLDRGRWRPCRARLAYSGIAPGLHAFAARAVNRRGRRSAAARFRWRLLEPMQLTIAPRLSGLGALYPGAPPLPLPLTVSNPNPVPVFVISLGVTVSAGPPGCAADTNLALGQSGASAASPLEVPAGGQVSLPGAGIAPPTIQLRDLPVNQDACQGASFPLEFSGVARG
jgi:hypothetical protein